MAKKKSCWDLAKNKIYPFTILLTGVIIYYGLIFQHFMTDDDLKTWEIVYLVFEHLLVFMTIWSYLTTYNTDPGKPPVFWGFYLDESEEKRKRYCLICHIFKPERCHHCSTCNRCVLNMDHHCPWLNSCVGHKNRKFFMMLLLYGWTTILFLILGRLPHFIYLLKVILSLKKYNLETIQDELNLTREIIFLVCYIGCCIFIVIMGMFFKFHIQLVTKNSTTIEYLEMQRSPNTKKMDEYDVGLYYNWVQVFGTRKWLWFIPLNLQSGRPIGDGVVFAQRRMHQSNDMYMQLA